MDPDALGVVHPRTRRSCSARSTASCQLGERVKEGKEEMQIKQIDKKDNAERCNALNAYDEHAESQVRKKQSGLESGLDINGMSG